MIFINGDRGNLGVLCDIPNCTHRHFGVNCSKDWFSFVGFTPAKTRKQARRRGWKTTIDGKGLDICPKHVRAKQGQVEDAVCPRVWA